MLQGSGGVWQSGWIAVEPQQGQTWGMFAHTPPGLKRLSKMLPSPCTWGCVLLCDMVALV